MEEIRKCSVCGGEYDYNTLDAFVLQCPYCGTSAVAKGGALGLTGINEKDDPALKKRVLESNIEIYTDQKNKYRGMIELKQEQLSWGSERYARFPSEPEYLSLIPVPPFWTGLIKGLVRGFLVFLLWTLSTCCMGALLEQFMYAGKRGPQWIYLLIVFGAFGSWLATIVSCLQGHFRAKAANGKRPRENMRRQRAYEASYEAAIRAAEPVKHKEDQRLRHEIVDLEAKERMAERQIEELSKKMSRIRPGD